MTALVWFLLGALAGITAADITTRIAYIIATPRAIKEPKKLSRGEGGNKEGGLQGQVLIVEVPFVQDRVLGTSAKVRPTSQAEPVQAKTQAGKGVTKPRPKEKSAFRSPDAHA